ncbi:hypothetical protein BWI96_15855 [Siphonobacter sp. SORGH_AS_0500]|uniref:hypothetical protein n=1 Tax=Siphonobacter sp. SORGH_AS_0500 TaxID=1864824 RepID=UPI000CAC5F9C|nr:hypothetical protein [Siphonobacter sp. SORGH_AS_0500]PKK35581.1 hypothetical protein BWI96_15855 [Siphonobacter sp. SORGH_AS_0500]
MHSTTSTSFTHPSPVEDQYTISVGKFVFLCFITAGLYQLWWSYKAWRFFKQKQELAITPALRALFGLFFLWPLFSRIKDFSKKEGYKPRFNPFLLFIGSLFFELFSALPEPYFILSFLSIFFFIPPFEALNYAKLQCNEFVTIEQESFNTRQIVLIVIGSILWLSVILEMFM